MNIHIYLGLEKYVEYEKEESLKMVYDDGWISVHSKVVQTCTELKTVKSQANTTVLSLIANSPNTQVSPSKGRRITEAFTREL